MKSSASKIQMTEFNDLFQLDNDVAPDTERVQDVPLAELHPFKGHPFQVRDDDAMQETADQSTVFWFLALSALGPKEVMTWFRATGASVGASWQARTQCLCWFVIWMMMKLLLLWLILIFSARKSCPVKKPLPTK